MTSSSSRVIVVGSLNADHRVHVAHLPEPGETILGSDVAVGAGGKGANQAVAAARAGAAAAIIGAIGDDRDGALVRRAITQEHVGVGGVRVIPEAPTGRAMITVDAKGENTIVVSAGANSLLTEGDINAGLRDLSPGDLVLLQLETPEPLVCYGARTASAAGAAVVLNAAPVPASIDGLFDHVDVLVVNDHELTSVSNLLCDRTDASRGDNMELVAKVSGARVVCTAGADGAFITHDGGIEHVEAYPVKAVDTTAAGDTFIGYLAAGLARDPADVIGATKTAVRAAGIAVTRAGAIDSIPFVDELTKEYP